MTTVRQLARIFEAGARELSEGGGTPRFVLHEALRAMANTAQQIADETEVRKPTAAEIRGGLAPVDEREEPELTDAEVAVEARLRDALWEVAEATGMQAGVFEENTFEQVCPILVKRVTRVRDRIIALEARRVRVKFFNADGTVMLDGPLNPYGNPVAVPDGAQRLEVTWR